MAEQCADERILSMKGLCGDTQITGSHQWLCLAAEHEKNPDFHYWVAVS